MIRRPHMAREVALPGPLAAVGLAAAPHGAASVLFELMSGDAITGPTRPVRSPATIGSGRVRPGEPDALSPVGDGVFGLSMRAMGFAPCHVSFLRDGAAAQRQPRNNARTAGAVFADTCTPSVRFDTCANGHTPSSIVRTGPPCVGPWHRLRRAPFRRLRPRRRRHFGIVWFSIGTGLRALVTVSGVLCFLAGIGIGVLAVTTGA